MISSTYRYGKPLKFVCPNKIEENSKANEKWDIVTKYIRQALRIKESNKNHPILTPHPTETRSDWNPLA